ncbi:MAG: hypothetical protein KGJ78_00605 [Alphaproteobacteria bacterium]|nr:hypothetical protein [Alphaproteobacteria bacterium]
MSNTLKAGVLTIAVLLASAVVMASSLKTAPAPQSYENAAVQHTADAQPMEVVTVVGTRRAS